MFFLKILNYEFFEKKIKLIIPRQIISLVTRLLGFIFQNVRSQSGVIFDPKNKFEGNNVLLSNTRVYKSEFGKYTYVSSNSLIYKTKIGRYSSIGNWVITGISRHPINFASTHPMFHSKQVSKSLGFNSYNGIGEEFETHKYLKSGFCAEIGSDVWIGDRVIIMDGVKVGDGAIIGAGSIVTKNVKPYEIVVGVPARHLRYRFSLKKIKFFLNIKWWNKKEEWLNKNAINFKKKDFFSKGKF